MEIPAVVKGYELTNQDKVRRALEGNPGRGGELQGGILLPDGTYDEDLLLATYDKMGGGIRKNGDVVKTGSFYDFARKAPRTESAVVLTFRINGEVVDVPEEAEAPAIVKAARTLDKQLKDKVTKKK